MQLVYISGVAEILLGALTLLTQTRRLACWGIVAMLTVFLLVHVQMLIDHYKTQGLIFWIAVIRLPLQFVLIRWAYKLRNTVWNYGS